MQVHLSNRKVPYPEGPSTTKMYLQICDLGNIDNCVPVLGMHMIVGYLHF